MANFYARYPSGNPSSVSVATVQGEGTGGSPVGGVLTIQGDPAGTPIPISGSITATNPSVSATGSAVPASATFVGVKSGANLIGLTLGQTTMAASVPVAIASDQAAVPVSGTVAVSGTVTVSGTVAATQSGTWNITNVSGTVSLPTGAATEATLAKIPVTQGSTTSGQSGSLVQGAVTTAAPSYTTAQTSPLSLTTGGSLRVDASSATVPTDAVASAATFQDGSILFSSLTTSFATVVTTGGAAKVVQLRNNTNAVVLVSLNAGSTTSYTLDSGDTVSVDLKSNGLTIATSTALQAKYSGSAPTSGSIRINVVY